MPNRTVKRMRPLLGTFVVLEASGSIPEKELQEGLQAGFDAVSDVEQRMSFYRTDSDVSRLNREAFYRPVRVSSGTYAVIQMALEFFSASEGVFDITVAPRLMDWGFLPGSARSRGTGTSGDIQLLRDLHIRFAQPLTIDLGGIAKGYAVDQAVRALKNAGLTGGIVNGGGDLRVFGQPRPVRIRHPRQPVSLVSLGQFSNRAIATSAGYFSRRRTRTGWKTPIVDPQGNSWNGRGSVTVIARDCLTADAMTKVAALLGPASSRVLSPFGAKATFLS